MRTIPLRSARPSVAADEAQRLCRKYLASREWLKCGCADALAPNMLYVDLSCGWFDKMGWQPRGSTNPESYWPKGALTKNVWVKGKPQLTLRFFFSV